MTPPRPSLAGTRGHVARFAVTAVAARTFGSPTREHDEATRTFLEAAVPAAGLDLDGDRLRDARGHAYADMAAAVLADVLGGRRLDLLVLAHVVPDLALSDIATISAGEAVGGVGASFGVSDQGSLAPFSALRLADVFAERQGLERAAVVVVDQHVLPYTTTRSPLQELAGDAAVVLLLERTQAPALRLAHRSGLRLADGTAWADAVADVHADLTPDDPAPVHVVAGAGIDPAWLDRLPLAGALHADPGFPCSGVWQRLARDARPGPGARTLVLEADPLVGSVHGALLGSLAG